MRLPQLTLALLLLAAGVASAQQVDLGSESVFQTIQRLRPGQYVWAPQVAPRGPSLLIVNLTSQRAVLYRNGVPIAASTVSTGKPGYRTPTGVFTILQKHVEHYSSKYDNAPMPYMQRLTWYGIALHGGHLPGYPASHGCIRLPRGFAKLLYGATQVGMTVVISNGPATPLLAAPPDIARSIGAEGSSQAVTWQPERSPTGPISIVVSVADHRAIVLRNGIEIAAAPVTVSGPVQGTWAYALRSVDATGQHWMKVPLSGATVADEHVPREEWQRFNAPEQFRRAIAGLVEPGTTIVVTEDSLKQGSTGKALTVIEDAPRKE